jgi:ABC-2 type transport system ATP-binding protein
MIDCQGLTKNFMIYEKEPGLTGAFKAFFVRKGRSNPAVADFDLQIKTGEMVGILGPNGAGKTTLMKMLTGIIVPSSGKVEVLGYEPAKRALVFRKNIALVMGQKSQLWWDIPAIDSFHLLKVYYEISAKDFSDRLSYLSELLAVKTLLNVHVRKLSLGERMKMELMASLLHNPKVLFLDEPTIGLDLVAQNNIRRFLVDYHRQHQTTILLTSHYMADVDALCDRIVLILAGKKRFDGSIDTFESILGKEKFVSVRFSEPIGLAQDSDSSSLPARAEKLLEGLHPEWNSSKTAVELRIAEGEFRERALALIKDLPVTDFSTEKLPVERVMKTLLANPELLPENS